MKCTRVHVDESKTKSLFSVGRKHHIAKLLANETSSARGLGHDMMQRKLLLLRCGGTRYLDKVEKHAT